MTDDSPHPKNRRLYGRAQGKPLSARRQTLVDDLLPALEPPEGRFDPRGMFTDAGEAWLEIGFGGAEHLIEQARRWPDTGILGVEPFLDGVAKALAGVEDHDLKNVRLHRGDAHGGGSVGHRGGGLAVHAAVHALEVRGRDVAFAPGRVADVEPVVVPAFDGDDVAGGDGELALLQKEWWNANENPDTASIRAYLLLVTYRLPLKVRHDAHLLQRRGHCLCL